MKSGNEVIDSVLDFAKKNDNVRAVIRTDLVPVREYLWNYNFYFIVNDVEQFDGDDCFEQCFGERILLYRGDKNYPEMFPDTKAHLMVFEDGITLVINAIDKKAFMDRYDGTVTYENVWIGDTFQKLLDKDELLPQIDRLEEKKIYCEDKPSQSEFENICAEYFWVLKTFAEYTLRKELLAAMFYLNISIRELLNRLINWYLVLENKAPVEIGILESNVGKLLEPELFRIYQKTYPTAEDESIWEAYQAVVTLWNVVGNRIAKQCGFDYPKKTEENMLRFIENLRK
ncbi:MAG: aminoglycoside 6-adenylyltransferase [Eubacteriales bacterium]|nr:aminoglycoside 6-adenylyltransferase [Eubacteriales bacterium]